MGWRRLEVPDEYGTTDPWYPEVSELLAFMRDNGIPYTASLVYAGCGSHTIALEWDE